MKKSFHLISTGQQTIRQFIENVMAVHEKVDKVHIRERSWTAKEIIETTKALLASGVPAHKIIINDRVDVADAVGAGGVQLPAHGIEVSYVKKQHPHLQIGRSVHATEDAIEQERRGADYILYGHVFKTNSKKGLAPRGIASLREIINHVSIPVIAIGGISPENTPVVLEAGVSGIAVLSGVLLAQDPIHAVEKYKRALEGFR